MAVDIPDELRAFFNNRVVTIILAIFPFIPFSLEVVIYRYLHIDYSWTSRLQVMTIILLVIGTIIAWFADFPRWSYPYVAVDIALLAVVILGSDAGMTFKENLMVKLQILLPVVILIAIVWLLTRRAHPAGRFIQNIRADWTLIPFMVYGLLPAVISNVYIGIRTPYGAPFLAMSTLFAIIGAYLFIVARQTWRKLVALVICATLAWLFITLCSATYWQGRQLSGMATPGNGVLIAFQYTGLWAIMLLLMFSPKFVNWIKRSIW